MGFFKVENFDSSFDWGIDSITGGFITVNDTDFEHLQEGEDKKNTLQIIFNSSYPFQKTTISKSYYTPIYFKFKDVYNKYVYYDTLRITYSAKNQLSTSYNKPEDFYISFGIKIKGSVIREWYLNIGSGCDYNYIDLDLQPIYKDYDSFDEIFFTVLKHPGNMNLLLGSAYLVQDFDELHNIKLAISDMLHLKQIEYATTLIEDIIPGQKTIKVKGISDLHRGTSLLFGDSQVKEVHIIKNVDIQSEDTAIIEFIDELDGNSFIYTWSANTEVRKTVPSSIYEMRDSESIYPLYFIYSEAFMNDEQAMHTGIQMDNFVKNADGTCQSATRKSWDAVSSNFSINVFSDVPETAIQMWRFLKSKITSRDILNVAGKDIQYIIAGERDIAPEDSETLPNYVMDLTFYFRHNLYNREYANFPKNTKMALYYEIKPVEAIT